MCTVTNGYLLEYEAISKVKVDVVETATVCPKVQNILVVFLVEVGEM